MSEIQAKQRQVDLTPSAVPPPRGTAGSGLAPSFWVSPRLRLALSRQVLTVGAAPGLPGTPSLSGFLPGVRCVGSRLWATSLSPRQGCAPISLSPHKAHVPLREEAWPDLGGGGMQGLRLSEGTAFSHLCCLQGTLRLGRWPRPKPVLESRPGQSWWPRERHAAPCSDTPCAPLNPRSFLAARCCHPVLCVQPTFTLGQPGAPAGGGRADR